MTNIENILNITTNILCQTKLYKKQNFIDTPHRKIILKILKDTTNLSYKEIGKHFNQSWFAIYKSCKDINDEYSQFYGHVLKDVKKVLSK